jgi:hypothetical protein
MTMADAILDAGKAWVGCGGGSSLTSSFSEQNVCKPVVTPRMRVLEGLTKVSLNPGEESN